MALEPTLTQNAPPAASGPPIGAQTGQIARAASVLSLGNVASRLLGLAVYLVKAQYFGAGGLVDAFNVASRIPTILYDLLVGGMVNSSLVPVFMEYVTDRRAELWSLISALSSLIIAALSVVVLVSQIFAPQIVWLLSSGSRPEVLALAASMFRIMAPALIFLSISGVLTGALLALQRPSYVAFVGAVMNAGTVLVTLLLHNQLSITSMALGILAGSIFQVVLQAPGLRDAHLRFRLALHHPGLRQVAILYAPIMFSLLLDALISRPVSYNLASQTGEGGISWMDYATTLREMPQGLVGVAISLAVLPLLALHARAEKTIGIEPFKETLARGLRLVMVLIIPAAVGLFVLSRPVVALAFEHGEFLVHDTDVTTQALRWYLLGLPFAAIDLLLVYAFYARQDTLTPPLIGVATTIVYLIMAFALLKPMGLFSLMFSDSFKLFLHALISAAILNRRIGGLGKLVERGVVRTLALTLLASGVMGAATFAALTGVERVVSGGGLLAKLALAGIPALVGAGFYLALVTLLRVEEMHLLWGAIRKRLAISDQPSAIS
jgi:putative peptidoglycan lipid II flippase